jgi:hypothetical protein
LSPAQYITNLVVNLAALALILVVFRGVLISSLGINAMKRELADIRKILQDSGLDRASQISQEQHSEIA